MLAHPSRSAAAASSLGLARSASVSISRDLLMSQFWQNLQAKLQPAVPNDRTALPGRKWLSGFFSIGSTQKPLERPYVKSLTRPSSTPRTKHSPALPFMHPAGTWAHVALHPAVGPHVPITGVDHRLLLPANGLVHHCLKLESSIAGTLNNFLHSAILSQWDI